MSEQVWIGIAWLVLVMACAVLMVKVAEYRSRYLMWKRAAKRYACDVVKRDKEINKLKAAVQGLSWANSLADDLDAESLLHLSESGDERTPEWYKAELYNLLAERKNYKMQIKLLEDANAELSDRINNNPGTVQSSVVAAEQESPDASMHFAVAGC